GDRAYHASVIRLSPIGRPESRSRSSRIPIDATSSPSTSFAPVLMPLVPLPFVVALLLLLLLAHLLRTRQDAPPNPPFLMLIAGCAVQSTLAGLRWGYGIESVRIAQPVVAAALPALLAASFGGLAWDGRGWRAGWIHAVAPVVVAVLMVARRHLVDTVLIAIYLGYAAMLLHLARSGPDGLSRAPL